MIVFYLARRSFFIYGGSAMVISGSMGPFFAVAEPLGRAVYSLGWVCEKKKGSKRMGALMHMGNWEICPKGRLFLPGGYRLSNSDQSDGQHAIDERVYAVSYAHGMVKGGILHGTEIQRSLPLYGKDSLAGFWDFNHLLANKELVQEIFDRYQLEKEDRLCFWRSLLCQQRPDEGDTPLVACLYFDDDRLKYEFKSVDSGFCRLTHLIMRISGLRRA